MVIFQCLSGRCNGLRDDHGGIYVHTSGKRAREMELKRASGLQKEENMTIDECSNHWWLFCLRNVKGIVSSHISKSGNKMGPN